MNFEQPFETRAASLRGLSETEIYARLDEIKHLPDCQARSLRPGESAECACSGRRVTVVRKGQTPGMSEIGARF